MSGQMLAMAVAAAVVLGVAAGSGSGEQGGSAPAVREGHPRLFITAADRPRLERQAAAYPEEWERIKSCALWEPRDAQYGDGRILPSASLAYLVTGEEQYLRSVVAVADHLLAEHEFNVYATPEAALGLAVAYDWCYGGLTQEERDKLAQGMLRLVDFMRSDRVWRHSDFNNHFVAEKMLPQVFAGLALAGDVADPRAAEMLEQGKDYLINHAVPAANMMAGESGGQAEGYSYDAWGYAKPVFLTMEAWRTATGQDLFPFCSAARNNALWNIYGRRPCDGQQEHFDDAGLGYAWSVADHGMYIYLLAARYRDGHAQWMGDQIQRKYDSWLWPVVLWRDPDVTPQPPEDLPLGRRFDGLGWVLMRSSWGPEATFASFQCGPFYAGHQHLDNNAFTIHKHALLAIDPGINAYGERVDDGYRASYYSRSVAHNTITVLDPEEEFPSGSWAGGPPGAANDGGQVRLTPPERVSEMGADSQWQVGRLAAYEHDPRFTYVVGDATGSYSSDKLRLFVRHFLYLPPDLFVIFDRVVATRAEFGKSWILHTVEEPEISGTLAIISNGPGRLFCRTLLPARPLVRKIGGPGKECWVAGRNWPSQEKEEWPPAAGNWRLEVSPADAQEEDVFLHVLQATGSEVTEGATAELLEKAERVGVRIRVGQTEHIVYFPRSGEPGCELRIVEAGRTVVDRTVP